MSPVEQHPLPPPVYAMQRLLSQPVDYTGEAAGIRYQTNRQMRGLAQWRHPRNGRNFSADSAASAVAATGDAPQPRVHPDRPRTFCLPDGWTSEGIWTADLARLHAATSRLSAARATTGPRRKQLAPPLPPPPTSPRQRKKKALSTPAMAFFQERTSVTLFGDEFQPQPQTPKPPMPDLASRQPQPQPQQPPQLPPPRSDTAAVIAAADAAPAWWVAVDPSYFVLEKLYEADDAQQRRKSAATSSVSVSAKRLQASGGLVAHIGRNGCPANSAPAAAAEAATEAQTRWPPLPPKPPKLCWEAELADPAATIIEASSSGARDAAEAATVEQRRSRRVVVFDHGAAGAGKETAAVLGRLRAQPPSTRQEPLPPPCSFSVADSAAVAPIADAVDRLRRSKTDAEVAATTAAAPEKVPDATATSATDVSKRAALASPAVVKTAPTRRHNAARRPPQLPSTKKPLVTRPFAAATFSPRYEADAGLVISTLTAATVTDTAAAAAAAAACAGGGGRISAGRRSLASPWRFPSMSPSPLALPKGGGGDYLTFVRSVPGQQPQPMWSTTVGPSAAMSRSAMEQHQRQPLVSAPMPSTPRGGEELELEVANEAAADEMSIAADVIAGAEAAAEIEAGLAAAAAAMKSPSLVSSVSLTSTKDSELLLAHATVNIPTVRRRRDPLSSSGGSEIGANAGDEWRMRMANANDDDAASCKD